MERAGFAAEEAERAEANGAEGNERPKEVSYVVRIGGRRRAASPDLSTAVSLAFRISDENPGQPVSVVVSGTRRLVFWRLV